ncbi:MAG: DMT family transporter [Pseudomonadota bacterium]
MAAEGGAIAVARARAERGALLALFAGALAIALSPIFVRLSELGPTATAFYRPALAVPALAVWLMAERRRRAPPARPAAPRDFVLVGFIGFSFAGDLAFWHWSVVLTTVANSTLLANFAPIFVALWGWALFGERFRPAFLAGMALAIAGCVLLMGQSLALSADYVLGDALGLVTAAFYAAYMMAVARARAVFSTASLMTWSAAVTALVLLPVALASGESLVPHSAYGWAILIGLALISHAGGQSLIAYALAHLPTAFSSVALLLQPAAAALFAWVILAEPVGVLQGLGGAVVLAGIALARQASRS